MDTLYPYFLTIHLVCAMIFLGFIFTDVVLLSKLKAVLGEDMADRILTIIISRGVKIMPICVLLLLLTGGAMISRYVGFEKGFFTSPMQTLLMIKAFLALCIIAMVATAIFCKFTKRKNPIGHITHLAILILGAAIVLLAKWFLFV